jgi:aminopeptidase N
VLSVLRGFSAPVVSTVLGQSVDDLRFLMTHDTDSFNRWDASQALATRAVLTMLGVLPVGGTSPVDAFIAAATDALQLVAEPGADADLALVAYTLTLPSENVLAEAVKAAGVAADPTTVHGAREQLTNAIASANVGALTQAYRSHRTDFSRPFELTTRAVGVGLHRIVALHYHSPTLYRI